MIEEELQYFIVCYLWVMADTQSTYYSHSICNCFGSGIQGKWYEFLR